MLFFFKLLLWMFFRNPYFFFELIEYMYIELIIIINSNHNRRSTPITTFVPSTRSGKFDIFFKL